MEGVYAWWMLVSNGCSTLPGHFAPPPPFPADTLLAPRPLPLSWETPPTPGMGFSMENRPPHPPGASDSPFPSPEQKRIKNIRNVHQEQDSRVAKRMVFQKGGFGGCSPATKTGMRVLSDVSEGVSTGVWCVPGFGAGFEFALEPSKLQKEGENPGKGHF